MFFVLHFNRFTTNRSLRLHCKHQPENKCDVCSGLFCTVTELNAHKQMPCEAPASNQNISVTQEYRNNQLNINESFSHGLHPEFDAMASQTHERMPKKAISQFECQICGRIFNKKYNMMKHQLIHSDSFPFECWACHKM